MRISDWSSDVCSSDLTHTSTIAVYYQSLSPRASGGRSMRRRKRVIFSTTCCLTPGASRKAKRSGVTAARLERTRRSEEHTSELQSLMRHSYAVFCLNKKKKLKYTTTPRTHKHTYTI